MVQVPPTPVLLAAACCYCCCRLLALLHGEVVQQSCLVARAVVQLPWEVQKVLLSLRQRLTSSITQLLLHVPVQQSAHYMSSKR